MNPAHPSPVSGYFLLLCRGVPCPGCPGGQPSVPVEEEQALWPCPQGRGDCHFLWTFTKAPI